MGAAQLPHERERCTQSDASHDPTQLVAPRKHIPQPMRQAETTAAPAVGMEVGSCSAYRRCLLKWASVRSHASLAAAASKRGVVSLLKPCCVPG